MEDGEEIFKFRRWPNLHNFIKIIQIWLLLRKIILLVKGDLVWYTSLDNESDLLVKCLRCKHQKVDHDRTASRDKMKCLIGSCSCKTFKMDKKYYKSSRKWIISQVGNE